MYRPDREISRQLFDDNVELYRPTFDISGEDQVIPLANCIVPTVSVRERVTTLNFNGNAIVGNLGVSNQFCIGMPITIDQENGELLEFFAHISLAPDAQVYAFVGYSLTQAAATPVAGPSVVNLLASYQSLQIPQTEFGLSGSANFAIDDTIDATITRYWYFGLMFSQNKDAGAKFQGCSGTIQCQRYRTDLITFDPNR